MANLSTLWAAAASSLLFCQTASATDWASVDDFDACREGAAITQTTSWQTLTGFQAPKCVMLDDGNLVAQISAGEAMATNINARKLAIPEGKSGVIYLKFRALGDSRYWGGVFGMASKPSATMDDLNVGWTLGNPSQGSRPNATFAVLGDEGDEILVKNRGRMNKAYADMDPEIEPDVWYSLWITIDNSRDEIRMHIQGGDFVKRTELSHFSDSNQNAFQFKTASASDLTHFVILNPTDDNVEHNPRSIQIDEINYYVQQAPSAVAGN